MFHFMYPIVHMRFFIILLPTQPSQSIFLPGDAGILPKKKLSKCRSHRRADRSRVFCFQFSILQIRRARITQAMRALPGSAFVFRSLLSCYFGSDTRDFSRGRRAISPF